MFTTGLATIGYLVLTYGGGIVAPSEGSGTATRTWYLQPTGADYQPATFKGAWDKTSTATTVLLTSFSNTATGTLSASKGVTTNPYRVCVGRGVSGPLAAQLISGTLQSSTRAVESNADAQLFWYVHLWVTVGNTDSVRGTLLADYSEDTTNEWPIPVDWVPFQAPQPLNPLMIEKGDRMVLEVGYISRATNDRSGSVAMGFTNGAWEFSRPILEAGLLVHVEERPRPDTLGHQRIETNFPPKALIVFSGADVNTGVSNQSLWSIGITDGVRHALRTSAHADNVATSDTQASESRNASIVWSHTDDGVMDAKAALVLFDQTGLTIQWAPNNSPALMSQFIYVVIGGAGVDAYKGRLHGPLGTGGPQTVTVDEIGWTPEALIFLTSRLSATQLETIGDGGEMAVVGLATLAPVANAFAGTGELHGANPSQVFRRQSDTSCLYLPSISAGTLGDPILRGAVTGPTASGFAVSMDTVTTAGNGFHYLALRGLRAQLVFITARTTSDSSTQFVPTTFVPKLILFLCANQTAISTSFSHFTLSAAHLLETPLTGAGTWMGMTDNVTPTQVNQEFFNAKAFASYDAASGAAVVTSEATIASISRTIGAMGFTLEWQTRDANARNVIALVLGDDLDDISMIADPDGGGTPTSGSNPGAEAVLSSTVPLALVTIQTDSGEQKYGKTTVSAPSTYQIPGWIEGRVLSIAGIRRALSDTTGALETGSCRIVLNDTDRVLRGFADSGVLLNKRADAYLATKAQVDAGTAPRRMFQGLIRQYKPLPNLQFEVNIEDRLGALLATKTLPGTTLDVATFPNLPTEIIGKPEPLCYGLLSDEALGAAAKGVVPAIFVGKRELTSSVTGKKRNWDEYLVCRGAIKQVQSWFARGYNPPHNRVKMPSATEDFDFLMPGRKGWTEWTGSAALYRTLNGKRYTVFYATGQRSDEAKDGRVPFALNIAGHEHIGDGTGTMIDSLPLICLHILTNWILQTATGNWMAIPTVGSPAYAQIDSASFTTVHNATVARMLALFGFGYYFGARYLGFNGQAEDARAALKSLCHDSDFQLGANRSGQIMASMEDDEATPVTTLRDVTDVLRGGLSIDHALTEMRNRIVYRYARRYVAAMVNQIPLGPGALMPADARPPEAEWGSGTGAIDDATSITNHGETRSVDHNFEWVRSAGTVQSVLGFQRERLKNGPIYVTVQTGLEGASLELGDVIKLQHYAGLDDNGYDGTELFRVIAMTVDLNQLTTTLELHDITDL